MSDPIDDDSRDHIWTSPAAVPERPKTPKTPKTPVTGSGLHGNQSAGYDRDTALRSELEGIKNINSVIESTLATLEKVRSNMNVVGGTVNNSSTLLNTWTRILSQTEHNQRLILDSLWKGATQDLADIEAEAILRQQAEQRRLLEEERRRELLRQKAEDEERSKNVAPSASRGSVRGTRSRASTRGGISRGSTRGTTTRGVTRGTARGSSSTAATSSSSGFGYQSRTTSNSNTRGPSSIGRGIPRGTSSSRSRGASTR
ncbi:hypothetical protein Cpir12675_001980 [Ceratocystis pirilliformis]|uniref:DASH complex subunit DUO1 n=1 Tax=Ceratocystis pirilliformis TaxID=259994 RepID=A0ABR3ZFM9_9PEZI